MSYRIPTILGAFGLAALLSIPVVAGKPAGGGLSDIDVLGETVEMLDRDVQRMQTDLVDLQGAVSSLQDGHDGLEGLLTTLQASATSKKKMVFVTSASFTGNLGGLDGADAKCQAAADAVGFGGTFFAWLSTAPGPIIGQPSSGPLHRFMRHVVPYVRPDGVKVADHFGDLLDGTLDNPINMTETMTQLFPGNFTWSSTAPNGAPTGGAPISSTCDNWTTDAVLTTATFLGTVGATDFFWSAPGFGTPVPCTDQHSLICVEQ